MRLTKRRNGIWMLELRDGGRRVRTSTGERDRARAEVKARELVAGGGAPVGRTTVRALLWQTYDRVWKHAKAAANFSRLCDQLDRDLGREDIRNLTYARLRRYADGLLAQGLAPATVNRKMSALGRALTEAVKLELLPAKPQLPRLTERNRKDRWITGEEELRLLAQAEAMPRTPEWQYVRSAVLFLLDTGARVSEALGLTAEDVTGEAVVFRDTKNGKHRRVPLTGRAATAVGHMLASDIHARADTDWLVRRFTRLRDLLALKDPSWQEVSLHTLRHTCASRLVQRGVDLYRVSRWLGHSSVTVTERYAHLAPSDLEDVVGVLA